MKKILGLLALILLLAACQTDTTDTTERVETTEVTRKDPPAGESSEEPAASHRYEFSESLFQLQMMGVVPLAGSSPLDSEMSDAHKSSLKDLYTAKTAAAGRGVLLTLDEGMTYRDAYDRAYEGIQGIYAEQEAGGKGAFYRVEHQGNVAYLLGSIHLGDSHMYPLMSSRIRAFENSDELWVELDTQDPELMHAVQAYYVREDGSTLKEELGEERFERILQVSRTYGLPLTADAIQSLKSWAILNQLEVLPAIADDPFSLMMGIDQYFITLARAKNKPIHSLETPQIQMETMQAYFAPRTDDLLSEIDEKLDLLSSEEGLKEAIDLLHSMRAAWATGEMEELMETAASVDKRSEQILLEQRDPMMADKISELLEAKEDKTYFIVVGALHLVPEGSVVDLLKEKGYPVEKME